MTYLLNFLCAYNTYGLLYLLLFHDIFNHYLFEGITQRDYIISNKIPQDVIS